MRIIENEMMKLNRKERYSSVISVVTSNDITVSYKTIQLM